MDEGRDVVVVPAGGDVDASLEVLLRVVDVPASTASVVSRLSDPPRPAGPIVCPG